MRITHISDLHFGHEDQRLAEGLSRDLNAQRPDLVVISGDFTQLGRRREFAAARAFLDQLEAPFLAVPGNHDVPSLNLVRRFLDPYGNYRTYISPELEPFRELDGVAIAGLKSSRRLRPGFDWSTGSIGRHQLDRLGSRFAAATPGVVRVVVVHHPLLLPDMPMRKRQKPLEHADRALRAFAEMGVRLVLSGHFHLSYVRRFEQPGTIKDGAPSGLRTAAAAPVLIAQASSTISTRLRGDLNAYNLIDIENGTITVTVREWMGETWETREKASAAA